MTTATDARRKLTALRSITRIAGPFVLPVTKSHPQAGDRRFQAEFPGPDGTLARVTIQQKKKAESYALDEDRTPRPFAAGRLFLFGKLTGKVSDPAPGFYEVILWQYPNGRHVCLCNCIGKATTGTCKHAHTLESLSANGLLPVPPEPTRDDRVPDAAGGPERRPDPDGDPDHAFEQLPAYRDDEW